MRYRFILALTNNTLNKENKLEMPMIGYVLHDNITNTDMAYSRKESYDLINEFGAENVDAKIRIDDDGTTRYYLKLKDKSIKINQFLKDYRDVDFEHTLMFSELIKSIKQVY